MSGQFTQLLRFCAVGLTCLGLSLAVLGGLHGLAGLNYLLAYVAAFIAGNTAGYLLNARFTFSVRSISHAGAVRYMLVNAMILCVNTAVFKFLVSQLHIWYITAAILLAAIKTPISFFAQRIVTYRLGTGRRAQNL
jgi:putative flippase GtrA